MNLLWSGIMPKRSEKFQIPITIPEKTILIKSRLATIVVEDIPRKPILFLCGKGDLVIEIY